ncbi:MAG: rubredoxin-like domain-containing protein [Promethearchaeati archaeon]
MPYWKCDKCGAKFDLEDIPEECPECGATDGTFSFIEK